jgi:hypothetical protein
MVKELTLYTSVVFDKVVIIYSIVDITFHCDIIKTSRRKRTQTANYLRGLFHLYKLFYF